MKTHRYRVRCLCRLLARVVAAVVFTSLVMAATTAANPSIAFAELEPVPRRVDPPGMFTEATITGIGDGLALAAFDPPAGFDPFDGYPDEVPDGSTPHAVAHAGTIEIADPITGRTGLAYCIDLQTDTEVGVHYDLDDWITANVPNLGYVGYILRNYFPTTDEPAGTDAERAAAVQAAIWFFTDNLVLAPGGTVRPRTEMIVADALENGPAEEPPFPELFVTPDVMPAPATGEIVGPFEVTADGPATIRSVGVEVFTDPDGVNLLEDGDEVPPGATLWVRSVSDAEPQGFILERVVPVLESTAMLYDGTNPGLDAAQKLVLAQETELVRRAGALIEPFPPGGVEITKQIRGSGAGLQGEVVIELTCEAEGTITREEVLTLDAGSPAGDYPHLLTGIPAGSECTIAESSDGDNQRVNLTGFEIDPETITIVENETQSVAVTNTYDRAVGALRITKIIAGPGAGAQGAVVIDVACDDPLGAVDRRFTIEAGAAAGRHPQPTMSGLTASTRCTIIETATGENDVVELGAPVMIEPATATIGDGETTLVSVTDAYVERDPDGGGRLADTGAPLWAVLLTALGIALPAAGILVTPGRGPSSTRR